MKLSDFDHKFYDCLVDGSFDTLGNFISSPGCPYLSFAEDEVYLKRACAKDEISCIICTSELSSHPVLVQSGKGIAVAAKPRMALNLLHNWMVAHCPDYVGFSVKTKIGSHCKIHPSAIISPVDVVIGDDVEIQEHVVIRPGTVIGSHVKICVGAVVGEANQISVKDSAGNAFLVEQVGGVDIGDHVSIGCYTFIGRGSFPYDCTKIGSFTTVEFSVEISHNTTIGENCSITGQCQICGNCQIGNRVRISPRSIVSNRITVADGSFIDIGSVVVSNLKENSRVAGNFAIDHQKFLLWHRKKLRDK